jgi:hypothetical protein
VAHFPTLARHAAALQATERGWEISSANGTASIINVSANYDEDGLIVKLTTEDDFLA